MEHLTEPAAASEVGGEPGRRTIPRLWRDAVAAPRSVPAYLVETPNGWAEVSFAEAARQVDELAHGLLGLGIRKGDAVAILGATRLEWALADLALAHLGAIVVPIYANSSPRDCGYVLEHSGAVAAIVEDDDQLAKLDATRPARPALRHVLTYSDLADLRARGREHAASNPAGVDEAVAAIEEQDLYTYIYTSGTTGAPKACMITHQNYYSMAAKTEALEGLAVPGDVMLLFLPLAHNFGRLLHLAGPRIGFTIAFLPDPLRVADALPRVRPTILPSVPRAFEKIHAAVVAQFAEARGSKRRIVDWALSVGRRVSALRQQNRPVPRALALQHRLADRLVYSKVKERLGGRLRLAISGGAPLAREIAEFFHALDILILEGYGLTECTTAATLNRPGRYRFGTVGVPLPGVELRLAEDGEILISADTLFAGYLEDEAATREVLPGDGWLRSGDIGELDADGFLTITDRKKDIIVTAGGKNVAPQKLENALKLSPHVSQALVVGDRRPYLVALIALEEGALAGRPADVQSQIEELVEDVNRDLSRFEQIKRFTILTRDFSAEEGEVTPTLKLKRRVCEEHFATEIEELYR